MKVVIPNTNTSTNKNRKQATMPKPIPVYDYRANKNGVQVSDSKIHGVPKCMVDGDGGCNPLHKTPHMGDRGLHGGVMIKENRKDKIVYH